MDASRVLERTGLVGSLSCGEKSDSVLARCGG